jgi:hypothetical protein
VIQDVRIRDAVFKKALLEIDPASNVDTRTAPAADTVNAVVRANDCSTGKPINVMFSVFTKLEADAQTNPITLFGASPVSETQSSPSVEERLVAFEQRLELALKSEKIERE